MLYLYLDQDYDGQRVVVNVPTGAQSQPFLINITDDDIVEYNEVFSLSIESVSSCEAVIGNVNTSEVNIINYDSK